MATAPGRSLGMRETVGAHIRQRMSTCVQVCVVTRPSAARYRGQRVRAWTLCMVPGRVGGPILGKDQRDHAVECVAVSRLVPKVGRAAGSRSDVIGSLAFARNGAT